MPYGILFLLKLFCIVPILTFGSRLQVQAKKDELSPIRTVPVQVAHELINAGHRYLDVRTPEEYAAGHVEGSINIPYMVKMGPGMPKWTSLNDGCDRAASSEFLRSN
jgi:hypothetical protein